MQKGSIKIIVGSLIILFLSGFAFAEKENKAIFPRDAREKTDEKALSEMRVEITNLKAELTHLKELQEKIYNSTITRLNWEFNAIIFVIGAIGVVLAVFGIKIVRKYLDDSIKNELSKLTDTKVQEMVNKRITEEWGEKYKELYVDYDKKFSEKYNEFSKIVENKRKS